jgi:hypothetical protein
MQRSATKARPSSSTSSFSAQSQKGFNKRHAFIAFSSCFLNFHYSLMLMIYLLLDCFYCRLTFSPASPPSLLEVSLEHVVCGAVAEDVGVNWKSLPAVFGWRRTAASEVVKETCNSETETTKQGKECVFCFPTNSVVYSGVSWCNKSRIRLREGCKAAILVFKMNHGVKEVPKLETLHLGFAVSPLS